MALAKELGPFAGRQIAGLCRIVAVPAGDYVYALGRNLQFCRLQQRRDEPVAAARIEPASSLRCQLPEPVGANADLCHGKPLNLVQA